MLLMGKNKGMMIDKKSFLLYFFNIRNEITAAMMERSTRYILFKRTRDSGSRGKEKRGKALRSG
ncbi:hypothetical protein BTO30_05355 [Domibacillus antri]|uniref:Uncharacterized protein n=1 Tax=Domibacillus antri TaxID=1714264 RepID=A0A1Q8Q7T1_9BACI|nr:hypothetical protein BTO30_05355 [Domibacillus antri]